MSTDSAALKWSSQLSIVPASRTPKLLGDKITLPPSALEALLAAAPVVSIQNEARQPLTSAFDPFNPHTYAAERHAREQLAERQQQLPHPLTFRIVNPRNGRVVYAGIREFSAGENEIGLSPFLQDALGLVDAGEEHLPESEKPITDVPVGKASTLTIHAKQLPKGTYVRLRPLEAGYDPEDWKSLLERYLRDNFTTLTNGEILTVPGGRHQYFRFLVDKFEPEAEAVCIVDTDLEVDIEALNEEQARETLKRKLAKSQHAPGSSGGSSPGANLALEKKTSGQVLPGEYVDYELKGWNKYEALEISLDADVDDAELDLFVSPFSAKQRSRPREGEHVFADFSERGSKRIRLSPTDVELEDMESIYISVHAYRDAQDSTQSIPPTSFTLQASTALTKLDVDIPNLTAVAAPDEVICKNCRQNIPKRTLPLHEAFCYRNNILCPHCSNVFLKKSDAWEQHWHCPHDEAYGNTYASKTKHDSVFHPTASIQCPSCDLLARSLPDLARHRTSVCPGKEILCQFCHLVVPQQGPGDPSFTDPEVLLSGLTPHELADSARTTECHLCNKIVRLRDMKTHLRFHDRDRIARPKPRLCRNAICGRPVKGQDSARVDKEQLGLCGDCFGPLYVTSYDPEGKALRRRIERRLLQQLMAGCGEPWCGNERACRTGKKNNTGTDETITAKDALPMIKPIMDELAKGGTPDLKFCVDEASQTRRVVAGMIASEGAYELEWCVKALEEGHNDLGKARDWLKDKAPRIGEVLQ